MTGSSSLRPLRIHSPRRDVILGGSISTNPREGQQDNSTAANTHPLRLPCVSNFTCTIFNQKKVGTPYWMAPEIIEMTGTTTACDVWSVGCTIIELLEGKPPYFDLPQMTALYKIVQDDHPPLPDGTSQALRDFLLQCFKKQAQVGGRGRSPRCRAFCCSRWGV
ncbi:unnamed protein product [Ectocarpus sp. 12 AP-2014]